MIDNQLSMLIDNLDQQIFIDNWWLVFDYNDDNDVDVIIIFYSSNCSHDDDILCNVFFLEYDPLQELRDFENFDFEEVDSG